MFKIYKNRAQETVENKFFDYFAHELARAFSRRRLDGILIGFPECLKHENLQIDALLISRRELTIIDFKNYSGRLQLPDEEQFISKQWTINGIDGNRPVLGGSFINPFVQLGNQKDKLINIFNNLEDRPFTLDRKAVSTMVCFQDIVEIDNKIPGSFLKTFFIADKNSFSQTLIDLADRTYQTDLLNEKFIQLVLGKLFSAKDYDLSLEKELGYFESIPWKQEHLSVFEDTSPTIIQLKDFLESFSKVLIINGSIGSNKSDLISHIRNMGFKAGYKEIRLLVISNRVKKNLMRQYEDVESLYSAIYDFQLASEDDNNPLKRIIPLKPIEYYINDEDPRLLTDRETIFIIDESQMISDSPPWDESLIRFGSGKLLSDIFEHLRINEKSSPNKVIFIGDKFQVSYGSWHDSALNKEWYIKNNYSDIREINLPDTKFPNPIQETCFQIVESIRNDRYNDLYLQENEAVSIIEPDKEISTIKESVKEDSKILVFSNQQVRDVNLYVKENIKKNGRSVAPGDLVLFDNQIDACQIDSMFGNDSLPLTNYSYHFGQPFTRITNGTLGEIVSIDQTSTILSHGNIKHADGSPIKLIFLKVQVRLLDTNEIIETYILEDFLNRGTSRLDTDFEQEYQIFLHSILSDYYRNNPFARGNSFFDKMIEDGQHSIFQNHEYTQNKNGAYQIDKKGNYRDPNDARLLTKYEREYRSQAISNLLHNKNSLFFKIYNAARLSYAWCMTVHKAMSAEWPKVILITNDKNRGRSNRDYFKWLYTGISRATNQVDLFGWKPISQFEKTIFGIATNIPKGKNFLWVLDDSYQDISSLIIDNFSQLIENTGLRITGSSSHNYQERLTITDQFGDSAELQFYYTGKGEIQFPKLLRGNKNLFDKANSLLPSKALSINNNYQSPLESLYKKLLKIFDVQSYKVLKATEYQDFVSFKDGAKNVTIQVWYDKNLSISSFNYVEGDKDMYDELVMKIRRYYEI